MTKDFVTVTNGVVELNPHEGQLKVFNSNKRIVLVLAGTQSGKTTIGAWWLLMKIKELGSGDYMVVTPSYPLLPKKVLPEFLKVFSELYKLGEYMKGDKIFVFSQEGSKRLFGSEQDKQTRVVFGHAQNPESLESLTAKAAWCDEAGQATFRQGSYEAIQRRLATNQGSLLITTTPYNLGWLKSMIYDRRNIDNDIEVINFDSTKNPAFPKESMENARKVLPQWRFDMFYRGMFTRPAGLIYDNFQDKHEVKPFTIPNDWPVYIGTDFGGVNTAMVFLAYDKDNDKYYLFKEYHKGGMTAKKHLETIGTIDNLRYCVGGAPSEDNWRNEFKQAGLNIHKPSVSSVEVGITRLYGGISCDRLYIFSSCEETIREIKTYSREVDSEGNVSTEIQDKSKFHLMDSLRYIATHIFKDTEGNLITILDIDIYGDEI